MATTQNIKSSFDVETVRRDFPALAQEISGHPLAYLDNGASTQKPNQVINAVAEFYQHDYSNGAFGYSIHMSFMDFYNLRKFMVAGLMVNIGLGY